MTGQQIIREYVNNGRINILFRHFPFIGDESWRAAEASECAAEQGRFKEYEETIFVNYVGNNVGGYSDDNLRIMAEMTGLNLGQFGECMDTNKHLEKVRADFDAGRTLGVGSTPTFFINGEMIPGLVSYGEFRVKIERALAEVGN